MKQNMSDTAHCPICHWPYQYESFPTDRFIKPAIEVNPFPMVQIQIHQLRTSLRAFHLDRVNKSCCSINAKYN